MTLVLLSLPGVAHAYSEHDYGNLSSVDPATQALGCGVTGCHQGSLTDNRVGPHGNFTATTTRCEVCHSVHVAASSSSLLFKPTATGTCLACHDGTGGYGVYGSIKARGLVAGASHRSVPPTTAIVPGGDPSGGSRTETEYQGEGGFLGCVDCHTPHGSRTVAEYSTERERIAFGYYASPTKMQSTNLLRQRPNGSDTTSTVYGSDWCAGCHRGRHSGGGAVNHPVDSVYHYNNVPLGTWPGPVEVAVDGSGNVYVADPGNHRIQRFNTSGGYLGQWNQGYNGTFEEPRGVTVAGGEVFVSDPFRGYVSRFNSTGGYIGYSSLPAAGRWGIANATAMAPSGLGSNAAGTSLVQADTEGHNVSVRSAPGGAFVRFLGPVVVNPFPGTAADQFNGPTDAAVDSAGNVFVADSMNKRVVKYGPTGQLIGVFATGLFERPLSIAVDASDRLYVADAGNHVIFRYLSTGALQATFGGPGSGSGQFSVPRGVAVDAGGNIYVVDSGNSRVQKLAGDGTFIAAWGTKGTGNGEFDFNPTRLGPLSYASTRAIGYGNVYGGLGYVMQEPRSSAQAGHAPICQQCHEDSRYAGVLYDGVALGGPMFTTPDGKFNETWFSSTDPVLGTVTRGPRDVGTPRFQNFPHETINDNMVVETNDDLCLNCHGKALP